MILLQKFFFFVNFNWSSLKLCTDGGGTKMKLHQWTVKNLDLMLKVNVTDWTIGHWDSEKSSPLIRNQNNRCEHNFLLSNSSLFLSHLFLLIFLFPSSASSFFFHFSRLQHLLLFIFICSNFFFFFFVVSSSTNAFFFCYLCFVVNSNLPIKAFRRKGKKHMFFFFILLA